MSSLLPAQSGQRTDWWESTENRVREIYERGELRGNRFRAEWLPDSSGYIVREPSEDGRQPKRVIYDLASGEQRASAEDAHIASPANSMRSPDERYILQYEGRNLNVRELATGKTIQLLSCNDDRDVHFQSLQWSPDGCRVVFIESDKTKVRQRPVLMPTDPSYPEVRQHRFARVGEKIPALRVGVVDIENQQIQWLPIEAPDEGFYLGQVEWAGNSEDVIVETLSRFRDQRDFLLIAVESGEVQKIYHESNEAWAVGSQGKNLGLNWVRDGEAFIVISEQDGWRHAFLRARNGEPLALLTPGDYDIVDRGAVDEEHGWFYFYASPKNATQRYLYRVPLDGPGTLVRITPEEQPGFHGYVFSPDSQWAFHTYSTFDTPPITNLAELRPTGLSECWNRMPTYAKRLSSGSPIQRSSCS